MNNNKSQAFSFSKIGETEHMFSLAVSMVRIERI